MSETPKPMTPDALREALSTIQALADGLGACECWPHFATCRCGKQSLKADADKLMAALQAPPAEPLTPREGR